MPDDFDEIEKRLGGKASAAPVMDDFDAIEARLGAPVATAEAPESGLSIGPRRDFDIPLRPMVETEVTPVGTPGPYPDAPSDKSIGSILGVGAYKGVRSTADAIGRYAGGVVDLGNEVVKKTFGVKFNTGEQSYTPVTDTADAIRANLGMKGTNVGTENTLRANGYGKVLDAADKGGTVVGSTMSMIGGAGPVGGVLSKFGVHGPMNTVLSFGFGNVPNDPKNPGMAFLNGTLAGMGGEFGKTLFRPALAALMDRWVSVAGQRAAYTLEGLGTGVGQVSAPYVDENGAVRNMIAEGDFVGAAEVVLTNAIPNGIASRGTIKAAADSLRSDAAAALADPVNNEKVDVTLWRGRLREAEESGRRLREQAKADAAEEARVEAATRPEAEPVAGEKVTDTYQRGVRRDEARLAAEDAEFRGESDAWERAGAEDLAAQAAPEAPAAPREEVIQPRAGEPTTEAAPSTPVAPKVKASERGGIDPDVVPEIAESAKRFFQQKFGSFIQRIRSTGGEAAREVADKAEKAVDATKKNLGEVSGELDAALVASGGMPGTEAGKAATALSRPIPVPGKDYFKSRLFDEIEGRAESQVPAERKIIDSGRALVNKWGEMTEARGVQQYDPRVGEMEQAPAEFVEPGPVRGANSPLLPIAEQPGVGVLAGGPAVRESRRTVNPVADPLVPEPVGSALPGVEPAPSRMTEAGNVNTPAPSGWSPFHNIPGGKVAPRIMTQEMMDIVSDGPKSPLWKKVIDAFADINQVDRTAVDRDFLERHDQMSGIKGPEAQTRRAQVEFRRSYRQVPVALRHNGAIIDLFETNTYNYFKRLSEIRAARLGVIEHFGQDIPESKPVGVTGQDAVMSGAIPTKEAPKETLSALRERYAREAGRGSDKDFTALMRGLHGGAIRDSILTPGSPAYHVVRGVNQALKVVRSLNLSASAVQNVPEVLGATSSLVGMPEVAKKVWGQVFRTKSWKDQRAFAEIQGAVTRDVMNLSYDPSRPIASGIRMFTELARKGFGHGPINEAQESAAATASQRMADRMRGAGGKAREIDVQRMMNIGLDKGLARRLADGTATEAEYAAFVRKAPGQVVGANLSPVEQSAWEANRVVKGLTAFHRYAWMSARGAANQASGFLRTMNDVVRPSSGLTPKERWNRGGAAARALTEYAVGKSLQGSAAYLLMSLATGGTSGLKIALNEMTDDPLDFAKQSFVYATVGGPLAAVARVASGKDELDNSIYPWFVAKQVAGLFGGVGQNYAERDFSERLSNFVKRTIPATRIFETGLVAVGLGNPQEKGIDTARRAFYRWRFDLDRKKTSVEVQNDPIGAEYRKNIRLAYDAMLKSGTKDGGTPEEVNEYVMKALGIKDNDPEKIKDSVLRKRLLTRESLGWPTDAELKTLLGQLKSRVGEDAYKQLELHDALLERLAKTIKKPTKGDD